MRTKLGLIVVFGFAVSVLAAVAAPSAFADAYPPPPTPDCLVKPTAVQPRQGVALIGNHWHHRATVNVSFQQGRLAVHLASPTTGFTGRFVGHGVIPAQAKRGAAVVLFKGLFRGHHAALRYRCSALASVTRAQAVPATNSSYAVTPMGFVPLVFLGATGLMYVNRRRRHHRLLG
jgi:hypothetical protein